MKNISKRLALVLASAILLGVMLTGCGGGGGGNTPSAPSGPSTTSEPTIPTDSTSEIISTESTSQSQTDEDGGYVLTKTYNVTLSDVELNSCVVVEDDIYWNETDGVSRVVSTVAVWREALESENEVVNALVNEIFSNTDIVCYIAFEYNYSLTGDVDTITIRYDDYMVEIQNNNGTLEIISGEEALPQLEVVLYILSDGMVTQMEQDFLGWTEELYLRALEFIENSDPSNAKEGIIETEDGAYIQYICDEDGSRLITWTKQAGMQEWQTYFMGVVENSDGAEWIICSVYASTLNDAWEDDLWEFIFSYDTEGNLGGVLVSVGAKDAIPITRYVQCYGFDGSSFVEQHFAEEDWHDLTGGSWAEGDVSVVWKNLSAKESPTNQEITEILSQGEFKARSLADTVKAMVDKVS